MRPIEPLTLDTAPDDVRPLMEPWQDGLLVIEHDTLVINDLAALTDRADR